MLVMKFGGASLRNTEAIRQTARILDAYRSQTVLLVVSAMGKTTNALEQLSGLAQNRKTEEAWLVFQEIVAFHTDMAKELFPDEGHIIHQEVAEACEHISRILQGIILLEDFPDRTYDRIVSYGEILSSRIVHRFLEEDRFPIHWKDARQLIRTDSDYKQADVNWSLTQEQIETELQPILKEAHWVITQGFIGSNGQGRTTTLGREGSDYSAAIFASCLKAEAQIVWKDVPGIMNADPALNPKAKILSELGYAQIVEMSYFGASVIHPKTIRPLRNAGIPLYVKSFVHPEANGTKIERDYVDLSVSTKSIKRRQSLIKIRQRDFSFWQSNTVAYVFRQFDKIGIEPRLTRISGQVLEIVTDTEEAHHVEAFLGKDEQFEYEISHNLELHAMLLGESEGRGFIKEELQISETALMQKNAQSFFYLK
jgi:aspartate kinase